MLVLTLTPGADLVAPLVAAVWKPPAGGCLFIGKDGTDAHEGDGFSPDVPISLSCLSSLPDLVSVARLP